MLRRETRTQQQWPSGRDAAIVAEFRRWAVLRFAGEGEAFRALDPGRKGRLDVGDFARALRRQGCRVASPERLFAALDAAGLGHLRAEDLAAALAPSRGGERRGVAWTLPAWGRSTGAAPTAGPATDERPARRREGLRAEFAAGARQAELAEEDALAMQRPLRQRRFSGVRRPLPWDATGVFDDGGGELSPVSPGQSQGTDTFSFALPVSLSPRRVDAQGQEPLTSLGSEGLELGRRRDGIDALRRAIAVARAEASALQASVDDGAAREQRLRHRLAALREAGGAAEAVASGALGEAAENRQLEVLQGAVRENQVAALRGAHEEADELRAACFAARRRAEGSEVASQLSELRARLSGMELFCEGAREEVEAQRWRQAAAMSQRTEKLEATRSALRLDREEAAREVPRLRRRGAQLLAGLSEAQAALHAERARLASKQRRICLVEGCCQASQQEEGAVGRLRQLGAGLQRLEQQEVERNVAEHQRRRASRREQSEVAMLSGREALDEEASAEIVLAEEVEEAEAAMKRFAALYLAFGELEASSAAVDSAGSAPLWVEEAREELVAWTRRAVVAREEAGREEQQLRIVLQETSELESVLGRQAIDVIPSEDSRAEAISWASFRERASASLADIRARVDVQRHEANRLRSERASAEAVAEAEQRALHELAATYREERGEASALLATVTARSESLAPERLQDELSAWEERLRDLEASSAQRLCAEAAEVSGARVEAEADAAAQAAVARIEAEADAAEAEVRELQAERDELEWDMPDAQGMGDEVLEELLTEVWRRRVDLEQLERDSTRFEVEATWRLAEREDAFRAELASLEASMERDAEAIACDAESADLARSEDDLASLDAETRRFSEEISACTTEVEQLDLERTEALRAGRLALAEARLEAASEAAALRGELEGVVEDAARRMEDRRREDAQASELEANQRILEKIAVADEHASESQEVAAAAMRRRDELEEESWRLRRGICQRQAANVALEYRVQAAQAEAHRMQQRLVEAARAGRVRAAAELEGLRDELAELEARVRCGGGGGPAAESRAELGTAIEIAVRPGASDAQRRIGPCTLGSLSSTPRGRRLHLGSSGGSTPRRLRLRSGRTESVAALLSRIDAVNRGGPQRAGAALLSDSDVAASPGCGNSEAVLERVEDVTAVIAVEAQVDAEGVAIVGALRRAVEAEEARLEAEEAQFLELSERDLCAAEDRELSDERADEEGMEAVEQQALRQEWDIERRVLEQILASWESSLAAEEERLAEAEAREAQLREVGGGSLAGAEGAWHLSPTDRETT